MPAPFTVEDETTGKALWSVDVNGNVVQLGDLRVNGNTTVVGSQVFTGNQTVTGNETVGGTLSVTGATTLSGTLGVAGLLTSSSGTNLTGIATPATPTTSAVVYATSGFLPAYVTPSGLVGTLSAGVQSQTSTTTVASTASITALSSFSVPANDIAAGAVYEVLGYGNYSTTGTPTLAWTLAWGGAGGTALANIPAITLTNNSAAFPFVYRGTVTVRSTTSVWSNLELSLGTNATSGALTPFASSPASATTITSTGANALVVAVTWSASSSSNTISLVGGYVRRVA